MSEDQAPYGRSQGHVDYEFRTNPSRFTRFLWHCAGADEQILLRCTHADAVKYASMGGFVLATGIMAAISGGFALWYVSKSIPVAIVFAIFWGLIIFNIDRFIISSTGKGDGTDRITWPEVRNALPRMLMGVILGIVISNPIELKIFEPEIESAIKEYKKEEAIKSGANYNKENQMKLEALKTQREEAYKSYVKAKENYDKYMEAAQRESDNPDRPGVGPRYKEAMLKAQGYKEMETKYEAEYKDIDKQLAAFESKQKEDQEKAKETADADIGILKRNLFLHEKSAWIPWMIAAVFVIIEVTPIFFKLMISRSPYDYLDENHKEIIAAQHGIQRKGVARTIVKSYDNEGNPITENKEYDYDQFHIANNKLEEKVRMLEAELKIKSHLIDLHEALRKKKVEENPEEYIKDGSSKKG